MSLGFGAGNAMVNANKCVFIEKSVQNVNAAFKPKLVCRHIRSFRLASICLVVLSISQGNNTPFAVVDGIIVQVPTGTQ